MRTAMKMEAGSPTCALGFVRHYYGRLARAFIVVCTCALVVGPMPLAAQTPTPKACSVPSGAKPAVAPRSRLQGVPNFGTVTATLYRGGQPTKEGFGNLAKIGINIVVDLRGSRASERQVVTGLGMTYVALPWHCYSPHDEHFAQFLTLLRQNPGKKVFVHCRDGDDRTGMDIAAYRMAEEAWTAQAAKEEMEAYGVNWFRRTICPGLASYEEQFPARYKTSPAFRDLHSDMHGPQHKP